MIEILVVMGIIGILVAIVATRVLIGSENVKKKATRISIAHVVASIERYSMDTGRVPAQMEDLVHRPADVGSWDGPYLDERELLDAWGRKLVYRKPGARREFDVISHGPNGRPDGDGSQSDDIFMR